MAKAKYVEEREPNGRRSRSGQPKEYPPAQVKRLRDAAMAGLRDPEWGTNAGRLFLDGTLSPECYAAAKWWREAASRYRQAICAPSADPRAISLEAGRGSSAADPDSPAGKDEARRHKGAIEIFDKAHKVLLSAGKLAERAVRRLCENDESPVGEEERKHAISGLLALATHRGLTSGGKSGKNHVR
jgi:hypothetical protein